MELFQTNDHYIILDGEYSLWCSRNHGTFEPKTGSDLCSAWNPVCIGLVYGVIGKIKLHPDSDWKLLLIRQQTSVGRVAGSHDVFNINKIAVLSLSQSESVDLDLELCRKHHFGMKKVERITPMVERQGKPLQKTWNTLKSAAENVKPKKREVKDKEKFEKRILEELIKMYNETNSFYYSQTFDLTNSIQRQYSKTYDKDAPLWQLADERFFWNRHMLKELIDLENELASHWIQPIIQGCIDIERCELVFSGSSDTSPLIPAPRIVKDPIDYTLILISRRSRHRAGTRSKKRGLDENGYCANYVETEQMIEFGHHRTSFVQVRGSIPVYWSQTGVKYRPPPKLDKGEGETHEAFCKHMDEQLLLYKSVSAVTLAELSGKEKAIGDAYLNHVLFYNSADVTYITFDFHDYCRGMKFENVSILTDGIKDIIKHMRYCWVDRKGMICEQRGVFRVNCVDCLDRTNVVQTAIARIALETQCRKLGLLAPDENLPENCRKIYQQVWANTGDAISRQYAGTAALKGDFTRTGERKISGMMKDGVNSANRYYLRFKDTYRQAAIDITHGQPVSEDILSDRLRMPEDDFRELMEKEENVKSLIEDCKKMLIVEPEQCMGGWSLINADPVCGEPDRQEMDMILLLSQRAVYVCWYDDEDEAVDQYQRIFLEDLEKMEIGPEASLFKSKNVCMRMYYRHYADEGFFHTFRAPSTRLFNNIVITVKNQEEAKESLMAVCQSFAAAQKILSIDLQIDEKQKLDKKKTSPHPEVFDVHKQLQENSLSGIKLPRDISSTDISSPNSSRSGSPAVSRKHLTKGTGDSDPVWLLQRDQAGKQSESISSKSWFPPIPKFSKNTSLNATFDLSVPKLSIKPMNLVNRIKSGGASKILSKGTSLFYKLSQDHSDGAEPVFDRNTSSSPRIVKRERKRTLSRDDSSVDDPNEIKDIELSEEVVLDSCGILATNTKQIFDSPQFSVEEVDDDEEEDILSEGCNNFDETKPEITLSMTESKIEPSEEPINDGLSKNHISLVQEQENNGEPVSAEVQDSVEEQTREDNSGMPLISRPDGIMETMQADNTNGVEGKERSSSFQCYCQDLSNCPDCRGVQSSLKQGMLLHVGSNSEQKEKMKSTGMLPQSNEKRTVIENSEADKILEKYTQNKKPLHHPHMRTSLSDSALVNSVPVEGMEDESPKSALDLDFQVNTKLQQKFPNILQSSAMPRKTRRVYDALKEQIHDKLGDKECLSAIIFL